MIRPRSYHKVRPTVHDSVVDYNQRVNFTGVQAIGFELAVLLGYYYDKNRSYINAAV